VAEHTAGLAGGYAGFLLAGLGAEVVRAADADDRVGAPGSTVLHHRKTLASWPEARAGADVVLVDDAAPGWQESPTDAAAVIRCSVRMWGRLGPLSHLPPDDALVAAATGVQALQWSWAKRPVWLATPMVSYMTGILAALGITGALHARARGAGGQRVEVSGIQGALALQSGTYVTGPGHTGSLLFQGTPRGAYPTYGLYRTADGWLFLGALTQEFWVKLMTFLGRIDLLVDERFQGSPLTFGAPALRDLLRAELEPTFASRPTAEWIGALRAADVPCGVVQSRAELLHDVEARALGYVEQVGERWQAPAPASFPEITPSPPPAPRPSATCLDGVRVVDLSGFIAGPFCPMLLADLGADVTKVETPSGDPFRFSQFGFIGWNRGKRSLVLDLKRPEGREVFVALVRAADVLVENQRPGVLERLGLGWDRLREVNPGLVHTSITGYGRASALPGFDPIFQARTGLMAAQGGDHEPVFHTIPYNDYCAGALAALATTAALLARQLHGGGRRVDVSLFRTGVVDQAAELALDGDRVFDGARGGRDHVGPSAWRRLYQCADGWLCVAACTPAEMDALAALAGVARQRPTRGAGGATVPVEDECSAGGAIAALFAGWSRAAALARLRDAGVPAAPCLGFDELWDDPHLGANHAFAAVDYPDIGTVRQAGPLVHFERTPIVYARRAPGLGEHGDAVLREIGVAPARIEALTAAGVVGRGG